MTITTTITVQDGRFAGRDAELTFSDNEYNRVEQALKQTGVSLSTFSYKADNYVVANFDEGLLSDQAFNRYQQRMQDASGMELKKIENEMMGEAYSLRCLQLANDILSGEFLGTDMTTPPAVRLHE